MKFAVALLVILPLAMAATIDEKRILEGVLGVDVLDLAKQVLAVAATDESEQQCEATTCPQIAGPFVLHNQFIEPLVCKAVCKEVQILAQMLPH